MVYITGKPAPLFSEILPRDKLRLIAVPYTEAMQQAYLPSSFSDADYPALVPAGQQVDTVAVGAVMAVFNWSRGSKRYRKVEKFVEAFFGKFGEFLKPPRHKKWQEINLSAQVPGWRRFEAAETWLQKNAQTASVNLKATFQQFLDQQPNSGFANLTPEQREELFKQFIRWQQSQAQ